MDSGPPLLLLLHEGLKSYVKHALRAHTNSMTSAPMAPKSSETCHSSSHWSALPRIETRPLGPALALGRRSAACSRVGLGGSQQISEIGVHQNRGHPQALSEKGQVDWLVPKYPLPYWETGCEMMRKLGLRIMCGFEFPRHDTWG